MKSDPGHFHGSRSLLTSRSLRRASRMRQPVPPDERTLSLISSCCLGPFRNRSTLPRKAARDSGTPGNSGQTGTRRTRPGQQRTRKHQKEQTSKSPTTWKERLPPPARRDTRKTLCNRTADTRPGDLQRQLTSINWARGVVRLDEW